MPKLLALAAAFTIAAGAAQAAEADTTIERLRSAQRTQFTDAEIIDGFLKTSFSPELGRGEAVDRIRKFEGPVRIFVDNRARPDRRGRVAQIVDDIRRKIEHIDLALTPVRSDANIVVALVAERHFAKALRDQFGARQARRIERTLEPQCLAALAKDASYRIVRSSVILIADTGDFTFRDCSYEEILQALGPINDDSSVPWSMFNDDVSLGFFGIYDQLLLNVLYHPQIKAGMTRGEVLAVLPGILPEVRNFVERINGLAP